MRPARLWQSQPPRHQPLNSSQQKPRSRTLRQNRPPTPQRRLSHLRRVRQKVRQKVLRNRASALTRPADASCLTRPRRQTRRKTQHRKTPHRSPLPSRPLSNPLRHRRSPKRRKHPKHQKRLNLRRQTATTVASSCSGRLPHPKSPLPALVTVRGNITNPRLHLS